MALKKLSRQLGGLNRLGITGLADDKESVSLMQVDDTLQEQTPAEKYAPYPPFDSADEVFVWEFLHARDPYWYPQKAYGDQRIGGSTRTDFSNDLLRTDLFVDGVYWHDKATAKDIAKRAALTGRGRRVLVFTTESLDDTMTHFAEFYAENLG